MKHKLIARIRSNWAFLLLCGLGFIVYSLVSVLKHVHFNSTGYDLTIFDQAIRNYSQFHAPASSLRGYANLLGDHFHPILILLAPLYWISNSPIVLLLAQAFLFISAALPIYLFSKLKIGRIPALLVVISFILCPPLLRAGYFDFHEIAFAVPLIAWAIYFIDMRRFGWMYISLGLLLLVKEDLALLVAMFGVYLLFQKQFKHGLIVLASGVGWFLLATKVFIPYFADGRSFSYWSYTELGNNPASAGLKILTHPLLFVGLLISPVVKVVTFIKTVGIYLGFTFLSPIIILGLPLILERFLSTNMNYWHFTFHYGATLTPILAMSATDGIYRLIQSKHLKKFRSMIPLVSTSVFTALAIVLFLVSPMNLIFKPSNYGLSADEKAGYAVLHDLPAKASVCTTNHIAPHVGSHQVMLVGFAKQDRPLTCDYAVLSSKRDQSPLLISVHAQLDHHYRVVAHNRSWVLYKKAQGV